MKSKQITNFKGLRENVDFADLSPQYANGLENIDIDNPYGKLSLREGSQQKYSDIFTASVISAYEYKYPTSGDVVLLINDNGTLKWYKNGVLQSNITLPSGSTIDTSFVNQYFGHDDVVRISAGTGTSNHVLWYGYLDRQIAENNGLFADAVGFGPDYKILNAQIVFEEGMIPYSDIVRDNDVYYWSSDCGLIYKKDSSKRTTELYAVGSSIGTNYHVNLASDGTYLYAWQYVPYDIGTEELHKYELGSMAEVEEHGSGGLSNVESIATSANDTKVFGVRYNSVTVADELFSTSKTASGAAVTEDTLGGVGTSIESENNASGSIFVLQNNSGSYTVERRVKTAITVVTHTYIKTSAMNKLYLDEDNSLLYVSGYDSGGKIYALNTADLTLNTTYSVTGTPTTIYSDGTNIYYVVRGFVYKLSDNSLVSPDLLSLSLIDNGYGGADEGICYYKASIIDINGYESPLSDVITTHSEGNIYVSVNAISSNLDIFYRVKYINIYRAFSDSITTTPQTDYKFLKQIDINDREWVDNTSDGYYTYSFTDNASESTISDVTYFENAGIEDTVKSRYVNVKYWTWLDNRLHCVNFSYDGDTYINKIIRTPQNQPDNIAFYDYYSFGNDGYDVLGITNAYGRAIIFKENRFGIFYDGTLEYEDTPGISSERGYAKRNDIVYFQHEKGIFQLNGNKLDRINDPVIDSFESVSDYSVGCLFIRNDKDRLIISYPEDKALVYNYKYDTWTTYDDNAAFKFYFMNDAGEYIAYIRTDFTQGLFYKIASGVDYRGVSGSGGTGISIVYDSPLIRFTPIDGMVSNIYQIDKRLKFTPSVSNNLNFKLYKYGDATRSSVVNYNIVSPSGSYVGTKTKYTDGTAFGEGFTWHLSGGMDEFEFNSITFIYEPIGMLPNE